jgi:hypothetical protein
MPGRRNKVPNVYNIHVPTEVAAHTQAAHALLAAVIKHLSFAREQCHAPYAQLEVHAKVCVAPDCHSTCPSPPSPACLPMVLSMHAALLQACKQLQEQQLQQRGRRKRLPSSARKAVQVSVHQLHHS